MSVRAPHTAVSIHRHLLVAASSEGGAEGELLAIGWNPPAASVEFWRDEGLSYLVLDRRTGLPVWVGEDAVRAIRHVHNDVES
jgi:hypothetical protein